MFKNALLASALGLSAYAVGMADARTQDGSSVGWYAALEGGANWVDEADGRAVFGPVTALPLEAHFETGWALMAEVGYRFESNWRLEFEAGFRDNDIDCVSLNGGACNNQSGDLSQFTQMVNVLYDIELDDDLTLSLGGGLGGNLVTVDTPTLNDSDYVMAGQLIASLSLALTEGIDLSLTYRYFIADDPHVHGGRVADASFDDAKHTLTIGLRFDLDPDEEPVYEPGPRLSSPTPTMPRPTLPPLPPPGEPKRYVIFFGFNKANLTLKALRIVAEAAETARQGRAASIVVTGHTDTVGPSGYNFVLSERRAKVVKRELVRLGVPADVISTTGKGETMLLVPTPDRTWEDRNRRATIDLN